MCPLGIASVEERSLLAICTLTYFLVAPLYIAIGSWPSGDESHYLLISETLIKYHSFDVLKAYQHRDYFSFFPGQLTPHVVRVQGRVLPLHKTCSESPALPRTRRHMPGN